MTSRSASAAFFLLLLLLFLSSPKSLWATQDVEIVTSGSAIEVTGGGARPWKLRYGLASKSPNPVDESHISKNGSGRAYFSHGQCLRLLDTERGIVLGRWLLPGVVTRILPQGESGEADITTKEPYPRKDGVVSTFVFDPSHAENLKPVSHDSIVEKLLPQREATALYDSEVVSADRARALIPEVQDAVRRDPFSPWFGMALGKLLVVAGEPGSDAVLEQAIHSVTTYEELLPMSAFLENLRTGRIADEAFRRGYEDFLQRGNDPRLVTSILTRLLLYPVDWRKIAPDRKATIVERIYQLTPYAEGADLAWQEYALSATTPEERRLWQSRAEETRRRSGNFVAQLFFQFDIGLLVSIACASAWWVFVAVSYVLYRRQRFYDQTVARPVSLRNRCAFINLQYWSMPQRIGFVLIFVVSWFCGGWMKQCIGSAMLMGEAPVGMASGDLATPSARQFLQQRLPATPDRDFLMAFSFQQAEDYPASTRVYQQLPQYAESRNNLGVIWRIEGREADAVGAFREALQLDPTLAEAAFNLGRPFSNYWTQIHQQYVPNTPMFAPPPSRVWLTAFAGGSLSRRLALASLGRLYPWRLDASTFSISTGTAKVSSVIWVLSEVAIGLTVLLFIFPARPVQQHPGVVGKILEILFPGTARQWGYAGGLVLVIWLFLLTQLIMTKWIGCPYILTYIATPNVVRAYGAETSPEKAFALINPGWVWLYLAPTVLAVLNVIVSLDWIKLASGNPTRMHAQVANERGT